MLKRSSENRCSKLPPFIYRKCGFDNLPTNILLNIFKNLNQDELRNNIIPVCQQWRDAAESPVLWKSLTFSGKHIHTSTICDKIWQYRDVEKIYLRDILEPIVVLRQICRYSDNLQHLTLRYCLNISEDSLRHLVFACKNLKTLDLKGTVVKLLIFYEELACAKNLIGINLSDNILLSRSNILTVAVNCRKLEEFHISTFNPKDRIFLSDSDCYFMIASLVYNLKSISLDCSSLNSYAFSFILHCKHLRHLHLNYAYRFEGILFESIWKNLPHLSSMKIIYGYQISDLNVKTLFEDGKDVLQKMQVIDFTGCCKVSDKGIEAIANCCKNLKTLVVRSCKNVVSLFPILQNCKRLELLNVAFCQNLVIDDLPVPKHLKLLFISDNNHLKIFADLVKRENSSTKIKICVSEFNKQTVNYE